MPWVVGIDEAGYGPNLGPLVQAAVALRLPDDDECGWASLNSCIHRSGESARNRLLIDDSKKVHSGRNGFGKLETGVYRWFGLSRTNLAEFLSQFGVPATRPEIQSEVWFQPQQPIGPADPLPTLNWPEGVEPGPAVVRLVHPPRFNREIAASGSKGTVLAEGLIELASTIFERIPGTETVRFSCDRQGGRQYYAPLVQTAFPNGWVFTDYEKPEESRYRVENLLRKAVLSFRPRADGESVAVAVASMLCKYLREVCMAQFNAYWQVQVPDLKPTAGYPVDARRFHAEIREAQLRLGISDDAIWRRK